MGRYVQVLQVGAPSPSGSWEMQEEVEHLSVWEPAELAERGSREGAHTIIDVAATDEMLWGETICRAVKMGCYVAVSPANRGLISIFDRHNLYSSNRVFFSLPLLYRPVSLELVRLLTNKLLGQTAGIDGRFVVEPANTFYGPLVLLYLLLGNPIGRRMEWKRGAKETAGGIAWTDQHAATIRCEYGDTETEATVSIACRRGSITCNLGHCDRIFLVPAGKPGYHLPLPEGNGLYYFQIDMIQGVMSGEGSAVLPSKLGRRALRWIQEIWNEGT